MLPGDEPSGVGQAGSGVINDEECLARVKTLLSYLPDSCHSPLPVIPCTDSAERECPELDTIMPDRANRSYDIKKVIAAVADNGELFEPHEYWAKNMVVAFIRIMGSPVGVIANNPRFFAGVLDVNASSTIATSAARPISICGIFPPPGMPRPSSGRKGGARPC